MCPDNKNNVLQTNVTFDEKQTYPDSFLKCVNTDIGSYEYVFCYRNLYSRIRKKTYRF